MGLLRRNTANKKSKRKTSRLAPSRQGFETSKKGLVQRTRAREEGSSEVRSTSTRTSSSETPKTSRCDL